MAAEISERITQIVDVSLSKNDVKYEYIFYVIFQRDSLRQGLIHVSANMSRLLRC